MADYFGNVEVKHPEWLKNACKQGISSLALIENGRLPVVLHGSFIVTTALHLLRCVYGSDVDTLAVLNTVVMKKVAEEQEWDRKAQHLATCRTENCLECHVIKTEREELERM